MVFGKDPNRNYTLKQTHNTHKNLPNQYHLKVLILSIVFYDEKCQNWWKVLIKPLLVKLGFITKIPVKLVNEELFENLDFGFLKSRYYNGCTQDTLPLDPPEIYHFLK